MDMTSPHPGYLSNATEKNLSSPGKDYGRES